MDLRSMLNEGSGDGAKTSSSRPQAPPAQPPLAKQVFHAPNQFRDRPPQPPPLQPPHHHDPRSPTGSSSYGSAQSPYQHTSASTLSGGGPYSGHRTASPSPGHGQQHAPSYPPSRDAYTSNAASHTHNQHFSPPSATPYTPPASSLQPPYYQHQRTQSNQSVPTPNSSHSQPPYPFRESPISPGAPPHSQPNPYQSHNHQQQSQPGTPLGPPPPYPRQSPGVLGHPPSAYEPQRPPSSTSYSPQKYSHPDERQLGSSPSNSLPPRGSPQDTPITRTYPREREREKSMSVSPKTVPNQIRPTYGRSPQQKSHEQVSLKREYDEEPEYKGEPDRRASQSGTPINTSVPRDHYFQSVQRPQSRELSHPPVTPHSALPSKPIASQTPAVTSPSSIPLTTQSQDSNRMAHTESTNPIQPPRKKRRREDGIPIFAQKATKGSNSSPLLQNKRQTPGKPQHEAVSTFHPASVPPIREERNGQSGNMQIPIPGSEASSSNTPLVTWEPSITNVIPHEDLTRTVSDFLFRQVVARNDFQPGESNQNATFEIEAKIGHLVDKDTNERIKIPVETECVVSRNTPNLRINFESSMTQSQHKELNEFLNQALKDTKVPPPSGKPPRIEMFYLHKYEIDRFYELTDAGIQSLPALIRNNLHQKHRPRVRITTDTKTGKEVARIIKIRIVDLDVHSPRTAFDWRISVNVEAQYEGDEEDLIDPVASGPRGAPRPGNISDRYKDRVSYRHTAYQIDLTQVKSADGPGGKLLEHELEVEISPQLVREQGQLAMKGLPNQYEDLIKGFVDNVRILARAVNRGN